MEAFKRFDLNGDGTADRKEIIQVLEEQCHMDHQTAVSTLHTFLTEQNLDPDGDGRVTFNEFADAVMKAKK